MGIRYLDLAALIIILITSSVYAETVTWQNSGGGSWDTTTNWNPERSPDAGDDAVITNASVGTVTVDSNAIVKTLTLGGGYKITLSAHKLYISSGPLRVFVTSATGQGNLALWADSGGVGGLAGGDSVCQAAADAAGLPGKFKAWHSTAATDAYCHVQGYTGKISANCGQGTLPVSAGPWVRTDGNPFTDTIDKLTIEGQVYTPCRYDEHGAFISTVRSYFTGTDENGTVSTMNCVNGTSNSGSDDAQLGATYGTTYAWTAFTSTGCSTTGRLICFQTGAGAPLSITAPPSSKKVFVTSVKGTGNLSSWPAYSGSYTGAARGDRICQNLAQTASIPNYSKFKAWLSDDTPLNAVDRITSDGPWYRLDGVKVANNKAALVATAEITTPLFTAISFSETGVYINSGINRVWTGTETSGSRNSNTCANWADGTSGYTGRVGEPHTSDGWWTSFIDLNLTCNNTAALYCFEDD